MNDSPQPQPACPTAYEVQEQLLAHVAVLADVTIDPNEMAFTAAHWPDLLERWLGHACRIAALDTLTTAYAEAIDVLRACPLDQVDATTRWLTDLGRHCHTAKIETAAEIARFREVSRRLHSYSVLVQVDPQQATEETR